MRMKLEDISTHVQATARSTYTRLRLEIKMRHISTLRKMHLLERQVVALRKLEQPLLVTLSYQRAPISQIIEHFILKHQSNS